MSKVKHIKRRRKLRKRAFSVFFFGLALIIYLMSSIFLKAYTFSLSAELKRTQNEIQTANQKRDILRDEIAQLTNRERVLEIARQAGLTNNQENITYLPIGD